MPRVDLHHYAQVFTVPEPQTWTLLLLALGPMRFAGFKNKRPKRGGSA